MTRIVQDRMKKWWVNNELESTWKEAVVTYFKLLYQHLHVGTKENYKNSSQESRFPGWDSNPGPQ
jgi:hypothetical protein